MSVVGGIVLFGLGNVGLYRATYEALKDHHDYNNYRNPDIGFGG